MFASMFLKTNNAPAEVAEVWDLTSEDEIFEKINT